MTITLNNASKIQTHHQRNRALHDKLVAELEPLGFVDLTSCDDDYPSLSWLGDGERFFEVRVQIGTAKGADIIYVHSNFEEYSPLDSVYYHGHCTKTAITKIKQILPAFRLYSILIKRGYEAGSTGGGCTNWCKDVGGLTVSVSNNSDADLLNETHDYHHLNATGEYNHHTPEFIYAGIDDQSGGVELPNGEYALIVPTNDTLGFDQVLANLEAIASKKHKLNRGK